MKSLFFAALAAAFFAATPAMAADCDGSFSANCSGNTFGGEGGDGGNAYSGSNSGVYGSGNSYNKLSQQQLQHQFNSQKTTATGGSAYAKGGSAYSSNKNTNSNGGNTISNHIEGDDYPVSTAVAGTGVSAECMGSSGVGVQTFGVGVSGGTNWFDEKCREERRAAMLEGDARVALLCQDDATREAMKVAHDVNPANKQCPQDILASRKEDLKKATYWKNPTTGKVHRVAKTTVEIAPGQRDEVAWATPRIGGVPVE